MMEPSLFRADLDEVPARLDALADVIAGDGLGWPFREPPRRLLLTGMGSSWFAATAAAHRLRAAGVDVVADLASTELTWPPSDDLVVVAISASGGSAETLSFAERYAGSGRLVALTNVAGSAITERTSDVVLMHAAPERSGVACRSFRHTVAALLALEAQLTGSLDIVGVVRRASEASAWLLEHADDWLPSVVAALDATDGTWFLAPAERLASALQGALMVREVPRRRGDGCETGDWSHVDVYLTKTLDYRAVVFAGSRHDAAAAEWMSSRGSTAVAVGGSFPAAQVTVRYPGDDDPLVALLTEVLVAELVAATWLD
jgi:fructoselysine-6-P-deglycase FrlB-like protein